MDDETEHFQLADAVDAAILMHRDAHFGGSFPVMIDYYKQEGKGVSPEFALKRVERLAAIEQQTGQNLAATYLTGPDAEKVAQAKEAYKILRSLYESKSPGRIPLLIADLILTEEFEPENEIAAVVKEKGLAVQALVDLLRADNFYDPLFPGYGFAPSLAAQCLARIGDKRAIIALFEMIGGNDAFDEEIAIKGLALIGLPAKEFLLKVLQGRPINVDNERAAIALIAFKEDEVVAKAALAMTQDPIVRQDIPLMTYLILCCEGLTSKEDIAALKALAQDPKLPKMLRRDIDSVLQQLIRPLA